MNKTSLSGLGPIFSTKRDAKGPAGSNRHHGPFHFILSYTHQSHHPTKQISTIT